MYSRVGKRLFDIVIATLMLICFAPIMLATAILVRLRLGSPILFTQVRIGLEGRPFAVVKFRSMTDACDENGVLMPDEVRLTAIGKLLRDTSLDELPQLWNVLRGDMSLVGPRPLLPEYLPLYDSHQARRHEVRPGITGWAQVNGRSDLAWEDRFRHDVHYVDALGAKFDLKILTLTLLKVLSRSGVDSDKLATLKKFQGTLKPTPPAF